MYFSDIYIQLYIEHLWTRQNSHILKKKIISLVSLVSVAEETAVDAEETAAEEISCSRFSYAHLAADVFSTGTGLISFLSKAGVWLCKD